MAVHVPITEAAKQEAYDKLMPSKNLLNPTNNSLVMQLKHEMLLGVYYATQNKPPQNSPKEFKSFDALWNAYESGKVGTFDAVRMNVPTKGSVTATAGQHLFNLCLPPAFIDYKKNVNMKDGKVRELVTRILEDPKHGNLAATQVINKLQKVGFKTATNSSISIGIRDFDPVVSIDKKKALKDAESEPSVQEEADNLAANFIDRKDAFEQAKSRFVQKQIESIVKSGKLGEDNPVSVMMASGARGNAGQVTSMAGMIGVGKDVERKATRPVNSSLLEGLSPNEFWDLSYDSRKGIFDKSIATAEPGALTRQIWFANKQTVVSQKDCGDTKGIVLNMAQESDRNALRGRVLVEDVKLKGSGSVSANKQPISLPDLERIRSNAENPLVRVRSPLTCKASTGVCQLCYGARPGSGQLELVPIGEPVGSIAAQALGEPSQQAIMKTFHVGAGSSSSGDAFARIQQILEMPKEQKNKTVLAEKPGEVTHIESDPIKGKIVTVDKKKNYTIGHLPLGDSIRIGAKVEVGDPLNLERHGDEFISFRDPREIMKLQGPEAARDFLIGSVNEAFKLGKIDDTDRRHLEVTVSNMMNSGEVVDPGTTKLVPGQHANMKDVESYNRTYSGKPVQVKLDFINRSNVIGAKSAKDYSDLKKPSQVVVKKGEPITEQVWEKLKSQRSFVHVEGKPVVVKPLIKGVGVDKQMTGGNWLEHSAFRESSQHLGRGSALFMEDRLDNPLTRQMTGLKGNFSDGFHKWKEDMERKFGDLF